MSDSSKSSPETFALGRIAGLLVLLSAALYFTGWTYRWSYFSFFQLEVTALGLSLESFYLAAFQVFFGSVKAVLVAIITVLFTAVGIYLSLWLVEDRIFNFSQRCFKKLRRHLLRRVESRLEGSPRPTQGWAKLGYVLYNWLLRQLRSLVKFRLIKYESLRFLLSLLDEILVVGWVVAALFTLAQWRGEVDAWRDVVHPTSTLPVVTLVVREETVPLGLNPDTLINPAEIRIIGERHLYENTLGNALSDLNLNRVWRLLIDLDGDYYIFPALPDGRRRDQRPPLVVIPRSQEGDRVILLRPVRRSPTTP